MDKKDCLYCENRELMDKLMIPIADLGVSKLYLFKEQTYGGRCIVAYNHHDIELADVPPGDASAFIADVQRVGRALTKTVNPAKINYGMYSDKLPHLHVHVVPKERDGYTYGTTFTMNPEEKYLTPGEYTALIEQIKSNL